MSCPKCAEKDFPSGLYVEKEIPLTIPPIQIKVDKIFQFWFIGKWTIPVNIDVDTPELGVTATGKACAKCGFFAIQDIKFSVPYPVKSVSIAKKK